MINDLIRLLEEKSQRDAEKKKIRDLILSKFDFCDYDTVRCKRGPNGFIAWRMSKMKAYNAIGINCWSRMAREQFLELGAKDHKLPERNLDIFVGLRLKPGIIV